MTFWLPGPWHRVGLRVMAHETIVAEVTGQIENVQAMADAQLCATAPELFDALEEMVGYAELYFGTDTAAMDRAKAVLKKAETL